jgi:hypothetical protein
MHDLCLQTCTQHISARFPRPTLSRYRVVLVNNTVQVTRVPDAPATVDQLDCMCHPLTLCYRLPLQTSPVKTTAQVGQHPVCCTIALQLGVQALQYRAAHTTKLDDAPPVMHVHSMKCPVQLVKQLQLCAAAFWAFVLCMSLSPLDALHACGALYAVNITLACCQQDSMCNCASI